jgi:two-component system, chemotaxis family, response regulator Rcp1
MPLIINGVQPIDILLVEDNVNEAEMTMETLREGRLRNRIHWVEDGEQALAFLRRENQFAGAPRPDLILLDLHMPRLGGLEVLAIIKAHTEWRRIPVVIMTNSSEEKDVLGAYNHHANCYITKPIDIDSFMEAVRSIEDFWLTVVRLPAA